MSEPLDEASIGKQVLADRYELGELINQGGMAEVRRGHDLLLDRTVAVKIFRRSDDPAAQRRFDDEARALARLAHPGLVAIFDVGTVDDRPFLVMECVEGTSMWSRLLAGPLPLDQGLRIGGALADALAHAHDRGVVHRAVQPSNILLDREDLPHLIDFGIALLAGSPPFAGENESLSATAYLAPEQLSDDEAGPPADVYALGSVLLECLSGEAEQLPTGLTSEVADLLSAMTSTEILDRPTAQTCASRLLAAVDDTPADVEPRASTSVAVEPVTWWTDEDRTARVPIGPAASGHGRPRWRLVAASVTGIAAVLATLVLVFHAPQPRTGQPQTEAADRGHSGSSASASSSPDRPGAARGLEARGSAPSAGTLIVHEHPAPATATPTTRPPAATPAPRKSHSTPTTPSSATPPPRTVVSTQPPTTASSEPPPPMSTSAAPPPSTNGGPSGGPGP